MIPSLSLSTGSSQAIAFGAAYTDIPGIAPFLTAGGIYKFQGYLRWSASATTVGLCPAMGGTVTPALMSVRISTQTSTSISPSNAPTQVHSGLKPGTNAPGLAIQSSTNYGIAIDGLIDVNLAGTLTICAKGQGTAGTATIAAGGMLILEQIA